ncbi:MAG TPA: anhydro-N-acetylmuramic acid kinase [Burkholderiales bacterium]|nr:anhydro-N-acetylmuramic acid kinase [Burkholderiales bacterium]
MSELYVGLMSGTSLDGVDAALVDFTSPPGRLVASHFVPYSDEVRAETLALNASGPDELERAAGLANRLAALYARATAELLARAGARREAVAAIGCHGQTVRHRPERGYTIQLANAALLAERSGVRVVADFRSRDVAAGGQGAPLVPAFHAACFAAPSVHRVIANVGGIANVTDLRPDAPVRGFDTGPGNVLMDAWAARHLGTAYDGDGRWAAGGAVVDALLAAMIADPFFDRAPPKSTGRDDFNDAWVGRFSPGTYLPQDVQATLTALTATAIARAVERCCGGADELLVCGGGAHNATLLRELAARLPGTRVATTAAAGVDPDWVEAMAFAWLARQAIRGEAGSLPEVTGALGPRVLGAVYPA